MYRRRRFAKMYADYADDIYRFLQAHVRDEMLAEDLTADTFTKAWAHLDSFDFRHARAWLYKIARNTLNDYWRTHHTVPLPEDFDAPDDRELIETTVSRKMEGEKLLSNVAKLPLDMKSVVTLRFINGYSARQTGKALGLSEGNVRIIQHRALKKLRELLK